MIERNFHNNPDQKEQAVFLSIKAEASEIVKALENKTKGLCDDFPRISSPPVSLGNNRFASDLALRIISMVKDLPERNFEVNIITTSGSRENTYSSKVARGRIAKIFSFLYKPRRELALHITKAPQQSADKLDTYNVILG